MENISTTPGFFESAQYLSGFLFVLLVLFILWLVIEAIGCGFRSRDRKKSVTPTATVQNGPASATAVDKPDQIPEEHLVVIASAVTLMLKCPHRLVSIRNTSADWGREGRRQHLHSHSFR